MYVLRIALESMTCHYFINRDNVSHSIKRCSYFSVFNKRQDYLNDLSRNETLYVTHVTYMDILYKLDLQSFS